jgi:dGTPase
VTKLARRRLQFDGLNLTRASLNAALKYPWPRASLFSPAERHKDDGVDRYKKWGVYSTESEDFEFAREILRGEFGQPGDKKTIEAEIMDWADDVAYALHDVEDFYRAGRIPLERFIKGEPEVSHFAKYTEDKLQDKLALDKDEIESILLLITERSPIERQYAGSTAQRAGLKASSGELIGDCVTSVSLASDIDAEPLLYIPDHLKKQVEILKQLTWYYVIDDRAVKTQQHGQRAVVRELFDIYFKTTGSSDRDLRGILPEGSLEELGRMEQHEDRPDEVTRARIVADIISSMTERQLLLTHRKLTGIELGSITDLI